MQVLSLTESPCGDGEDHSIQQVSEFWLEERRAYLKIISSLKDLITKIQVQRESEVPKEYYILCSIVIFNDNNELCKLNSFLYEFSHKLLYVFLSLKIHTFF